MILTCTPVDSKTLKYETTNRPRLSSLSTPLTLFEFCIKANEKKLLKSEIQLKLARKADNRLFLSFVVKKVVESV